MYKNQVRDCIALGEYKGHNWLIRKGLYGPLGFDTSHYYSGQTVKNKAFVQKECLRIIDQLSTKKGPLTQVKPMGR